MSKITLTKPALIMLYGFPGAGKTYFARQLCEELRAAHVQNDRIRSELFEEPHYDKRENDIVMHLMDYMTEEFLSAGVSVVFDVNAMRFSQRRSWRDLARKAKAEPILIWLQIDPDTAVQRVLKRDRRKADDKYAIPFTRETFQTYVSGMQNPNNTEDYIVISGKHTFNTQRNTVFKRLYEIGLIQADSMMSHVVKPELVNLVPKNPVGGRVDMSRRNIIIR
jgi:predicted kinase